MSRHSNQGSLWNRWDLHFHTPSSFDYEDSSVTNKQIVDALIEREIGVVAITDHHTIDITRIQELQQLAGEQLTVLPGIELRSDQGGDPIHYIGIFPENCNLSHIWTMLQGICNLTPAGISEKGGDQKVYVPMEKGAKAIRELGGSVSIHAGTKTNSIECIKNTEQFQQRIKYDITKEWVDILEIGQLKDIDIHLNIIFPNTGLNKPLVICSDNHKISNYTVKSPLWLRADPMFRGLLMILREPRERIYIGDRPPEMVRVEQNPTKYISGISFQRKPELPATERWFSGDISFNPGLVAIIGNKGSGKSALVDTIGLTGASKNGDSFSFLHKDRFRHPKVGYAEHFEATLKWKSGEEVTRCLMDTIKPEEIERVKYLPQGHIEKICNELVRTGEKGFEQELKNVIFSHVPESQRLGQSTLDDLVVFQTGEKQKRIDSLLKQLRDVSRLRTSMETKLDPSIKRELEENIKRYEIELKAHEKIKPIEKNNPTANGGLSPTPQLLTELDIKESIKKNIEEQIQKCLEILRVAERRHAVAKRLLERLDNFQKDYTVFQTSLVDDVNDLGLISTGLISLSINKVEVEEIRNNTQSTILEVNTKLSDDLKKKLIEIQARIAELQLKLDTPNREYQIYLKDLAEWQEKKNKIIGNKEDNNSLNGLKTTLETLDLLPQKIDEFKSQQTNLALEIHFEKIAQTVVYRNLYGTVQEFINFHPLATDKLKLEFKAELTNENFAERLLETLALNKRGSFMGIDEGYAKANSFVQSVKWEETESIKTFLHLIDNALHFDCREQTPVPVQLKDQLLKGRKIEDVFDLIYGLEYIQPRYILRWEGKDLSMLSAGERGTLLLVFYLLIDKSNIPLIIDQPEGNLDNHTVAKVLVDCIRETCKRRQVFIVTHNPNLAVVCDADQIVHASMDKSNGNNILYICGALENPAMSEYMTNVLEGTRWAFDIRDAKYEVGEHNDEERIF